MRFCLTSFAVLSVVASGPVASFAQEHPHEHGDHGHPHGHGDHGHAHADHGHDDGGDVEHHPGNLRVDVEAEGALAPGQPVTLNIQISRMDGTPVGAGDLSQGQGGLLHVMIVDEGLEDYHHLHPQAGEGGRFTVTFTPEHPRIYRVWVDAVLAEPFEIAPESAVETAAHDHGGDHDHDDHGHDDHDHGSHGQGDHAGHAAGVVRASDWVRVGDEAAPFILPLDALDASAGALTFTLAPKGPVRAGSATTMTLSVADADGAPVTALEPYLGAFAHLVGFSAGASNMAHAHPAGAEPSNGEQRAGPDLDFEVSFNEAGVHRLFVQVRHEGVVVMAPFTVVVAE